MAELGLFLSRKSVNGSDGFSKIEIGNNCLRELANYMNTKLLITELYIIALLIYFDPRVVLKEVFKRFKLTQ